LQPIAPFLVPLRARDLRAAETAGHHDLHALGAESEGRLHRLLHRATEGHAALQLSGDRLRNQLGVELGALNLLDVDVDLTTHLLGQVVAQLVHLGALATDDDPWTRGVDRDADLVRGALDVDLRHPGVIQPRLELLAQLQVGVQEIRVVALGVPARMPGLVVDQAKSVGMSFLTH
jgi:hypothetical protein